MSRLAFSLLVVSSISLGAYALTGSGDSASGVLETVSPVLSGVTTLSESSISATFSEPMQTPGVTTSANYAISGSGAGSLAAHPAGTAGTGPYALTWTSGEMRNGATVTLTATNLQDLLGNPINGTQNSASCVGTGIVPTLGDLAVTPGQAAAGDTVTITFTSSETLGANPVVRVNGHPAVYVNGDKSTGYTYQYLVLWNDPVGMAVVSISGFDPAGNQGTLHSSLALEIIANLTPLRLAAVPLALMLLVVGIAVTLQWWRRLGALLLVVALCAATGAWAANPAVLNVTFAQTSNATSTQVDIYYDLVAPNEPCAILLSLSKDGGADGFAYPIRHYTGDIANVTTGTHQHIVWDIRADYPEKVMPNARIRVTADDGPVLHTLNYTAGPNGSISGTFHQGVVHGGTGTAVTAVPNPDAQFVRWNDGVLTATRQDMNVTADIDVVAEFTILSENPWAAPFPGHIWSNRAVCLNQFRELGLMLYAYIDQSYHGDYPRLSSEAGRFMFREDEVYPQYLYDPSLLLCPGRVADASLPLFDDAYYIYCGYLLTCDDDVLAFANAYTAELAAGGDFSHDLPGPASYGPKIYRLQDGVERFVITDVNDPSQLQRDDIPIMFEWPDNHQEAWGGNVLYIDGHAEWQPYPGKFPMTETCIATLAALAGYTPPTVWRTPDPDLPYTKEHDPNGFVSQCRQHLLCVDLAFRGFKYEQAGNTWPPLATESGRLMMDQNGFYPEYLTDPDLLLCPGVAAGTPPPHFNDRDYLYFGYVLRTEADVAAFASAYAAQMAGGGDFTGDLPASMSYGSTMYRLRDGIERFVITDIANSAAAHAALKSIPVMMEWPDNHEGLSGGHVLYLDGHVEWLDYPGEFPMTAAVIATLDALGTWNWKSDWADPNPVYLPQYDPYGFVAKCQFQMLSLGMTALMFSYENSGGYFPILSSESGRLMFVEQEVYPEYLTNPDALICPGPAAITPPPHFDDRHYVYLGYMLLNDDDVDSFVSAYAARLGGGGDFSTDLAAPASYGSGDTLYRLREGVERFTITDINDPAASYVGRQDIPIMMEWPDNHENLTGGHVLYLDGHVEWHQFPGEFPMSLATVTALDSIANWQGTSHWATKSFTKYNDPRKQALCQYNMACLGLAIRCFDNDNHAQYPPLSNVPNTLMFSESTMLPHYLQDPIRFNCPGSAVASDPPTAGDQSYVYFGYMLLNDSDVQAFATAYASELAGGGDFTGDLPATVSYGDTIYRLREGIERFTITDINNPAASYVGAQKIPVMIEWPDNHGLPFGGNVLFLDGHAEWIDFPGPFPMTAATMTTLATLAGKPYAGKNVAMKNRTEGGGPVSARQ